MFVLIWKYAASYYLTSNEILKNKTGRTMSDPILNISLALSGQIGTGSLSNLGKLCAKSRIKKPLIVTDPTMVKIGIAQKVIDVLTGNELEYALFDQCVENPNAEDVQAGAKAFVEGGCDGVIALGGGSPMDQAKAIRVVSQYGGEAKDFSTANQGYKKIKPDIPAMIAIPTTSGTGSEATAVAVITDTAEHKKFVILSPFIKPNQIILDPELTKSVPPMVTAATGFDALVHALESFVTPSKDPFAYGMAKTAFELIGKSLKTAVHQGDNLQAREDMAIASLLAGSAFAITGLGAVHALAHPLTAIAGIPHGTANSLMLPHVMKFNARQVADKYVDAARTMGFDVSTSDQAIDAIANLAKEVGLPTRLSEAGVEESMLEQLSIDANNDGSQITNPVPVTQDDLMAMYKAAM
jgi:alcohol dehydrogenase class IV